MSARRLAVEIVVCALALWGLLDIIARLLPDGWPI